MTCTKAENVVRQFIIGAQLYCTKYHKHMYARQSGDKRCADNRLLLLACAYKTCMDSTFASSGICPYKVQENINLGMQFVGTMNFVW